MPQDLLRADVVVDTWNLRKQAFDVLGQHRYPSVDGISAALVNFGFDVRHVFAAVACDAYSDNPSSRVQAALDSSAKYVAAIERSGHGTVLHGRLTDRSGQLEEKLVDVLCAVQIARCAMQIATGLSDAECIVVISQDIDLTPAFELAAEFGVPVYAVANKIVDTRPGDWLIVGDGALLDMCGRPFGDAGAARKLTLARQLLSGKIHRQFEFCYFDSKIKEHVFRHRTGVEGRLPASQASGRFVPRQRCQFYSVDLAPAQAGSDFPQVRLSYSEPVSDSSQHLVEGEVVEWVQPTRVRVRRDDGILRAFDATPGTLMPGMRVALHADPASKVRLIGGIEKLPPLDDWASPSRPKLATVDQDATIPGGTVRALVDGLAQPVALLPPRGMIASRGDRLAVVPRDCREHRVTKVMAVSTAIRGAEKK